MDRKKLRKRGLIVLVVIAFLATTAWAGMRWQIQSSIDEWCDIAQQSHPIAGDNVASLLVYVQSDDHSLTDRDHAVWALGQLRDPRALPVLQSYLTGKPCDHAHDLCQHELTKAIDLCAGRTPNPLLIAHD